MDQFSDALSIVSIAVAGAALGMSWWSGRRSLLRELHEMFISERASQCRGRLHAVYEEHGSDWVDKVSEDDRHVINHAFAQLDHLSFHVTRGYVSRADAGRLWARAIYPCRERGEPWIKRRRDTESPELWLFIDEFCQKVEDPRPKAESAT